MKIACISTAEIPSTKANSIQVMKVCQALVQIGESVQLYIPAGNSATWEELAAAYGLTERFPIVRLASRPFFKRLDFTLASLAQARREKVNLIYTRMLWAAFLARLRGLPAILELHDLPSGHFAPMIYRYYLRMKKPKLTVYITTSLKRLADERFGVQAREGEFLISPDGVDLARYIDLPEPRQARKALNLAEMITAVYSGGFYAGRGLDMLQQLAIAFPQVQFLWIGGSEQQVSAWSERLTGSGVKNVILTGFIFNNQLPLYQATADVLLMPYSLKFGGSGGGDIAQVSSPLKLFEYMAAGRCILASDLPVLREILNEKNACFFQPEDFNDLCERFSTLIANSGLRKKLGAAAREDVKAYEWKTRMARILNAVSSLVKKME